MIGNVCKFNYVGSLTYSDLEFFEGEVVEYVTEVLDAVKNKSFVDYVLLLARAGYQVETEGTFLSPYVVGSRLEIYQDRTREQFLVDYLNNYASILREGIYMTDDYKEYDLNIQMMIYAQIWESHQFLKTLKRISGILIGKPYEWRISFEYVNEKGKVKPVVKANMIQDQIIADLKKGNPRFGKLVESLYDSLLRNDFAHASYYVSVEDNAIMSLDSERYAVKKKTDLLDWEQTFVYSVLLSYHLPKIIRDRRNSFTKDYPDIKYVEIDWPSYKEPGKILKTQICPQEFELGVEFIFKCNL